MVPVTEETGVFTLLDDEGNEIDFQMLDSIVVDDVEYVLAALVEPEEGEENYAYVFRVEEDEDGEEFFVAVDDDEEFERVETAFRLHLEDHEDYGFDEDEDDYDYFEDDEDDEA